MKRHPLDEMYFRDKYNWERDHAEETMKKLATRSYKRLNERIDVLGMQAELAFKQGMELGWELLDMRKTITIYALHYKQDNKIPDAYDEIREVAKTVETYRENDKRKKKKKKTTGVPDPEQEAPEQVTEEMQALAETEIDDATEDYTPSYPRRRGKPEPDKNQLTLL